MTQHAILNNVEHADLKVRPLSRDNLDARKMCVSLSIGEFRSANRNLPIVYYYEPTQNQYFPMALLGFEKDENLFLSETGWAWGYIPAMLQKGPFNIGQQPSPSGELEQIVSIDLDNPSVNTASGQPIFLAQGGNSDYLLNVVSLLQHLSSEHDTTTQFCARMDELGLFEPFSLELELRQDHGLKLSGFFIINEEKLATLDAQILAELSQLGFLQAAYTSISSLSNLTSLVDMKKRLL